ncbi:MAG: glycosyltransferase family 39 protein [Verrucomicrobia bacterium]|nr:glycosyltransferase family 39 protein [Verrucomicrobiota bacterium]
MQSSTDKTDDQSAPSRNSRLLLALAIVYAMIVLFAGLGTRGLNDPDEGRYAEEAREMLERLQTDPLAWLEETLDGEPYYSKPPLTNWLTCVTMKLLGLNEWGARMPAALAALGAVLVAMSLARRMGGERWAALAGVILPTSLMFFIVGRLITTDMILVFFMTSALAAFWFWFEGSGRRPLVFFWLALSGAMMTKGPVGVAVPLLVIIATLLVLRQPRRLLELGWLWGLPLFVVLGLGWYLQACIRFDLWWFFLGQQVAGHYFKDAQGHPQPIWYYAVLLLVGALPWTLCALTAGWRWREETQSPQALAQRVFLVIWVVACLVFFSMGRTKLATYILPVMVPMGLLAARFWEDMLTATEQPAVGAWRRVAAWSSVLFTALVPVCLWYWLYRKIGPARPDYHWVWQLTGGAGVAVLLLAVFWARRSAMRLLGLGVVALPVFLIAAMGALANFEDLMESNYSFRTIGLALRAHAKPDDMVAFAMTQDRGHGICFYSRRLISKPRLGESPEGMQHPPPDRLLKNVDQIWEWVRQGRRVFCVIPTDRRDLFLKAAPVPFAELIRTRSYTLWLTPPAAR